jgi:osmotically-inducible protein OsmY
MSKDAQLQQAVQDELAWEPMVTAAHIGVTAHDGIVTLTGHVPNFWEKGAAETAAARVRGVKAVVDEMRVELLGNPVPDERLAEDALRNLASDTSLPDDGIQVKVENGHITLTGEVEWKFQQTAAELAVHKLPGVRWVSNKIRIRPRADVFEVRQQIRKALDRIAPFEADNIVIHADGGKVTLSGEVDTAYARSLCEEAAWSVPGVTDVDDRIAVGW